MNQFKKIEQDSQLPELPSDETRAALDDLLVRVRLNSLSHRIGSAQPIC